MKKSDLKAGMLVQTRNGNLYMLMKCHSRGLVMVNDYWNELASYSNDLKCGVLSEYDIMSVYDIPHNPMNTMRMTTEGRNLLWKREKTKKMTVEEVEKELGYKIEIVSDH